MANDKLLLDQAADLNIETRRGDAISTEITVYDGDGNAIDFTVYANATLQVKDNSTDSASVLELTLSGGQIALGATGEITLTVDGALMDIEGKAYVYDLEVYNSSVDRKTILHGSFTVNEDVTRD